jgi:signal transduction histidine kinase
MGAARFAYGGRLTHATRVRLNKPDLVADFRLWYLGGTGALIALYYAAAKLGYALQFSGPVAAIVWLPVGVGIAFLYLAGLRFWPGVVVGDLLVNNYSALPFGTALGQTFGNLLEVVAATVLLHRLVRRGPPLGTVGGVARMSIALAVGTAISATVGSLSSLFGDVIAARSLASVWRTWWLGDLSGALLVVPLVLAWYRPLHRGLLRRRSVEALAALASVAGLSALAFNSAKALAYLAFPGLIWSAVRLRSRGATAGVALAAAISIWATRHYVGPFSSHSLAGSVLETQLFIVISSFTTLCLAAAVTERELLSERLSASRARVIHAADNERRRLEHNLHDGAQQLLTGLMVRLGVAGDRSHAAPSETEALIKTARSELGLAIEELRELAHGNHPAVLTEEGLGAAIAHIGRRSSLPVEVVVELPSTRLGDAIEATAYYVVAEAVANAQKYSHAKSIRLCARVSKRALEVEVADDGIGGAVETPGSGLEGLRDRVEAFGGAFELASRPGRGTKIAATLPLARFV